MPPDRESSMPHPTRKPILPEAEGRRRQMSRGGADGFVAGLPGRAGPKGAAPSLRADAATTARGPK